MTKTEYFNSDRTTKINGWTVWHSSDVCLGFCNGVRVKITDPSGYVVESNGYVPSTAAMFARDYKRFPARRFAQWLIDTYSGRCNRGFGSWA